MGKVVCCLVNHFAAPFRKGRKYRRSHEYSSARHDFKEHGAEHVKDTIAIWQLLA